MNFPTLPPITLTGHQHETLILGTIAIIIGIVILYWEMTSQVYRSGCLECQQEREKQKSAGPDKSPDQRNRPGAGGGGWRV